MESRRYRAFIGTLNNPIIETAKFLERLFTETGSRYICGLLEQGLNGTPHIQYYIYFKD